MTNSIKILKGKVPILLSAPHVFPHKRPHLEGLVKQREEFTDVVVKDICNNLSCWGIFTTQPLEYDPNYDKESRNEYKSQVRSIVKNEKIKYVIDVHGLSDLHQYDLSVSFKRKFTKSSKLGYLIAEGFRQEKLHDALVSVLYFKDDDQETISEFVCDKLKIPAVQIEISWYLREDDVLRAQIVSNISAAIEKLL